MSFKTILGVISGQLQLSIDPEKEQFFKFKDEFINFEIMPEDKDAPVILDT